MGHKLKAQCKEFKTGKGRNETQQTTLPRASTPIKSGYVTPAGGHLKQSGDFLIGRIKASLFIMDMIQQRGKLLMKEGDSKKAGVFLSEVKRRLQKSRNAGIGLSGKNILRMSQQKAHMSKGMYL